ncbi:uncharacterized protein LY79DRAFT_8339 [Colletotrichum navitas]|uniref:Uncharacterized protein n=1 Tax=Colletotrichum navitas TaxID=681940 RepID=A0AAD8QD34_9PEZI|nr:uncharacterized protein LY79DRAFT_8339 [Colletotrichum navitas]KAK1600130.1 hypothetical protein LY79DRAFT_8339 [Colletotrichum navitas]
MPQTVLNALKRLTYPSTIWPACPKCFFKISTIVRPDVHISAVPRHFPLAPDLQLQEIVFAGASISITTSTTQIISHMPTRVNSNVGNMQKGSFDVLQRPSVYRYKSHRFLAEPPPSQEPPTALAQSHPSVASRKSLIRHHRRPRRTCGGCPSIDAKFGSLLAKPSLPCDQTCFRSEVAVLLEAGSSIHQNKMRKGVLTPRFT